MKYAIYGKLGNDIECECECTPNPVDSKPKILIRHDSFPHDFPFEKHIFICPTKEGGWINAWTDDVGINNIREIIARVNNITPEEINLTHLPINPDDDMI